jgi:hypothetical protein
VAVLLHRATAPPPSPAYAASISPPCFACVCGFQGFRLVFHFARNPYFVNSEITKEFYIQNFVRGEKVLLRTDGYGRCVYVVLCCVVPGVLLYVHPAYVYIQVAPGTRLLYVCV